ncbi:MAG: sensor histidine kinase [Candidatus Magasanikbacteria bacterium]|nr:sensor histidine kinase [Candidatus Magasanikbacteria bacterium]
MIDERNRGGATTSWSATIDSREDNRGRPLELIDEYDRVLSVTGSSLDELGRRVGEGVISDEDQDFILRHILEPLDRIMESDSPLPNLLPKDIRKKYYGHDADSFRRAVIGNPGMETQFVRDCTRFMNGERGFDGETITVATLRDEWRDLLKNWEAYRFIMQDLFAQADPDVGKALLAREREQPIDRLVAELKFLLTAHYRVRSVAWPEAQQSAPRFLCEPSESAVSSLRIDSSAARIFRVLQNAISNAVQADIATRGACEIRLWLDGREGRHLRFSLADNGRGMPPSYLDPAGRDFICRESVSHRGSSGLGLAHADTRLAAAGAELLIMSRERATPDAPFVGVLARPGTAANHTAPTYTAVRRDATAADGDYRTYVEITVPIIT